MDNYSGRRHKRKASVDRALALSALSQLRTLLGPVVEEPLLSQPPRHISACSTSRVPCTGRSIEV